MWLHGEEQLEMESLRVTGKRRLSVSRARPRQAPGPGAGQRLLHPWG